MAKVAVEPVKPAPPPEHEKPCRAGEQRRESDLCAEWQSADQAEEASKWAARSFWLAVVGLVGLVWTLYLTRKSTKAAVEALDAQITSNRPLMSIGCVESSCDIYAEAVANRTLTIKSWITNYGASGGWTEGVVIDFSGIEPMEILSDSLVNKGAVGFVPSGKGLAQMPSEMQFTVAEFEPILKNRVLHLHGWTKYRDAGGNRWQTGFAGSVVLDEKLCGSNLQLYASDTHWFDKSLPRMGATDRKWYQRLTKRS